MTTHDGKDVSPRWLRWVPGALFRRSRRELARRAARAERREEHFRLAIEAAPVALLMVDEAGTIVLLNARAEHLLGYARNELLGHPLEVIVPQRLRAAHAGHRAAFATAAVRRMGAGREVIGLRKDGSEIPIEVDLSPVATSDGTFVLSTIADVSERRELERRTAELVQARNAALEAARAKADFLANMSHEIRTPMCAIQGYAELLSDKRASRAERDEYIAIIRRNGEHLLHIINDILDLSKIEAGKLIVERVECSPARLVSEVESLMRHRAAGKGLAFDLVYRGPIPTCVQVDPTRVRQILMNLVGNAIKFTETGRVELAVEMIGADEPGPRRLRFSVTDTGIGIAPEAEQRLFEPFAQEDTSTTRRFGGTGLGLAISKRLAEALGGQLTVRSAPGRGSTFSVVLDCGSPEDLTLECPRATPEPAPSRAGRFPRLRGRILLAEDAPDSRRLIVFFLRQAGAEVVTAETGRVACALVLRATQPFDLILMDMQMPELDGYDATAELRRTSYTGPIIALTAHAMEGDREKCLAAGCSDFVTKPVDRRELLVLLRRYLESGRRSAWRAGRCRRSSVPADDVELGGLLASFVAHLPTRAATLETSLAHGDAEAVAAETHRLKGTAASYGFPGIGEAATGVLARLRAGAALAEVADDVRALAGLCRRATADRRSAA
jgi:PAS domain S-box-containing protein